MMYKEAVLEKFVKPYFKSQTLGFGNLEPTREEREDFYLLYIINSTVYMILVNCMMFLTLDQNIKL